MKFVLVHKFSLSLANESISCKTNRIDSQCDAQIDWDILECPAALCFFDHISIAADKLKQW